MYSDTQSLTLRRRSRLPLRTVTGEVAIIAGFISYYIPMDYAVPPLIRAIWQGAAIFTSAVGVIKLIFSRRLNSRNASSLLYYLWWFIGTKIFVGGNFELHKRMGYFAICAGFFAFLDYLLQTRGTKTTIKYFLIAGLIMSAVHFTSYAMGSKRTTMLFLKHDNGSIYFFIQIMVLLLYWSVYYNRRVIIYFAAYSAIVLYMFYELMSATAIVASTYLAAVLVYLYTLRKKRRKNIPRVLTSCKFTVFAGIVFNIIPLIMVGSAAVADIVGVFGKSVTFSYRDVIWARSMMYFLSSPFYGMGLETDITTTLRISINHCHNLVVENLYRGGIIAMFLFLFMLKMHFPKRPDKYKCAMFCAGMMSFFITSAFDWYYYYPLPLSMIVFNYYLNKEEEDSR